MRADALTIEVVKPAGGPAAGLGALGVIGPDRRLVTFITDTLTIEAHRHVGDLPAGPRVLGLLIDGPKRVRLRDMPSIHPSSRAVLHLAPGTFGAGRARRHNPSRRAAPCWVSDLPATLAEAYGRAPRGVNRRVPGTGQKIFGRVAR